MSDSYLAPAPAPRQLDIIADTALRETTVICQPKVGGKNHCDLSTRAEKKNHCDLSTDRAKRIGARRKQLGVSTSALVAAAGLYPQTYFLALRGSSKTRASTLDALEQALDRFAAGQTPARRLTVFESYLRTLIKQLALQSGWDPELMLSQDFSSENTNDPVWLQASRLRRCAIYLMVEGKLCSKAEIARVIGVSRQAAHKTVAAIETERGRDTAFDTMMGSMMLQVAGQRL